jgi:hypothetical protein
MLRPALVLLPLLISGCAAPALDTHEPLPAGRAADLRYVSRLAPAVAREDVQPSADRAAEPAAELLSAQAADGPYVRIECAQYEVDAGSLPALAAQPGARAFARVAPRADVQRVLDARIVDGSVKRSGRPAILVRDGGRAALSTTSQQSFVEAFEITRAGADLIGDPCIATTVEGSALEVRAKLDAPPSIGVEISLKLTELLRPLHETSVRVPGASVDVTVQVPLALRQELASSALLAPDEVLVLGGLLGNDGTHDLLVVVDARRDEGGGAGRADRAAP